MISGYNTDIEYNGTVYHVQTEDKGFETPLILSLVYTGGEILAAKRSPYNDLLAEKFDEKILAERLQRQHRLICAAITQGRIEDLKRMSSNNASREAVPAKLKETPTKSNQQNYPITLDANLEQLDLEPLFDVPFALVQSQKADFGEIPEPPMEVDIEVIQSVPVRVLNIEEFKLKKSQAPVADVPDNALIINLIEDREFFGGDRVELAIEVRQNINGDFKSISGASVMIKVLGSAFRPIILQTKTADNGLTVASFEIPRFKTGRGAILIRVNYGDNEAELRRIISYG